jgi:DeoR/GlpR family transcriptional regulator of sugar metabolism
LYKGKTDKTLTRDINELAKAGLLKNDLGRIMANKEEMRSFLPTRKHT